MLFNCIILDCSLTLTNFATSCSQATDADSGVNGQLAYNITAGDLKHRFQVNNLGQVLSTDVAVGRAGTVYNLNVTATDNIGLGTTSMKPANVKVGNGR